jgi:hypothetical protein
MPPTACDLPGTSSDMSATMARTYARRLLSPYIGLVQVIEFGDARALSLDGRHWAIQYTPVGSTSLRARSPASAPRLQIYPVATIDGARLQTHALHPFLDRDLVGAAVAVLAEAVAGARLPFAAVDSFEYWLLDGRDERPLALIHSCIRKSETRGRPPRPAWVAMPAAQLDVSSPGTGHAGYVPPVNYRLQKLIGQGAGPRPRAAWFHRESVTDDGFPPCLIREDWDDAEAADLCERYQRRLAPRLLMLQGLPPDIRERLEREARAHAFDVERFHPLYPDIVDRGLINAARVEARLRRNSGG